MNAEASARAKMWLDVLSRSKLTLFPVYPHDYKMLANLCGADYKKLYTNSEGKPRVFFVNREDTINKLKSLYGFFTKEEASKEINEAARGSDL